jgi:glutaredoxin
VSVQVVVYGAPGCHLCDEAKMLLRRERGRLGFDLVEVDISGDPELEACYRKQIPVVTVDGRKAFKYRVEPVELERRVRSATIAP